MLGFGLLLAHLIGDYIAQNDWMAARKARPWPGLMNPWDVAGVNPSDPSADEAERVRIAAEYLKWREQWDGWWVGTFACLVHCVLYAAAFWVVLAPFYALPWWFYAGVFALHVPVDRFGLARRAMRYTGHEVFATKVFSPWSIVLVDNILHLAVAYFLAQAAEFASAEPGYRFDLTNLAVAYSGVLFWVAWVLSFHLKVVVLVRTADGLEEIELTPVADEARG
jgi:hypothetical protein